MQHPTIIKLTMTVVIISALSLVAGCHSRASRAAIKTGQEKQSAEITQEVKLKHSREEKASQSEEGDLAEREEIRQSYELSPGAQVTLSGVNGQVKIETADIKTAEVYIVRSARKREDLEYRQVQIEHSPTQLSIRVENKRERSLFFALFSSTPESHQRVVLKLPRDIELSANGVKGPMTIGEIAGQVRLNGISGNVKVAQASGSSVFNGINGSLEATITGVRDRGVRVNGINGNVEMRLAETINADLIVRGVNGNVTPELPKATMKGKRDHSNFTAQLGEGGAPITISGVNGNVRLLSANTASGNVPTSVQ